LGSIFLNKNLTRKTIIIINKIAPDVFQNPSMITNKIKTISKININAIPMLV